MITYYFNYNCFFFFFNDTATTEIYTLSLHDALPISSPHGTHRFPGRRRDRRARGENQPGQVFDEKATPLRRQNRARQRTRYPRQPAPNGEGSSESSRRGHRSVPGRLSVQNFPQPIPVKEVTWF